MPTATDGFRCCCKHGKGEFSLQPQVICQVCCHVLCITVEEIRCECISSSLPRTSVQKGPKVECPSSVILSYIPEISSLFAHAWVDERSSGNVVTEYILRRGRLLSYKTTPKNRRRSEEDPLLG